jgi:cell division septation protein DedD
MVAAAVAAAIVVTGAGAWARVHRNAGGPGTGEPAAAVQSNAADVVAVSRSPLAIAGGGVLEASPVQTADSITIGVASFRTEQRARAVAAQLVDAGFPAFVRPRGDGLWQQVIVGPYVSREEAAAAQRAMAAQGVAGTEVRLERTEVR